MTAPSDPSVYHIVHVDRLSSVIADGHLWCDEIMAARRGAGTTIGMPHIKQSRLKRELVSRPGLHVGQCVPFYFCPRSVMLYLIARGNHRALAYRGGQTPILHFEGSFDAHVEWAEANGRRWAFTLSNAAAGYTEDRCDRARLDEIDWQAVRVTQWAGPGVDSGVMERKQSEFLVERSVPWELVARIGVNTPAIRLQVEQALRDSAHRPVVEVLPGWYY